MFNDESSDFWKAIGEEDGECPEEPIIVCLFVVYR